LQFFSYEVLTAANWSGVDCAAGEALLALGVLVVLAVWHVPSHSKAKGISTSDRRFILDFSR